MWAAESHVATMCTDMILQMNFLGSSVGTQVTGIWFFSTVGSEMLLKTSFLTCTIGADWTGKRLLSSVCPTVTFIFPFSGKCLVTVRTLEVLGSHQLLRTSAILRCRVATHPASGPTSL